ncbi:hypothetical protein BH23ACT10_BH23ACT10_23230 [soil metagenome]
MDGYKHDLRHAYDVDAARRDRRIPESWRLDVVDRFADRMRSRVAAARVMELGCGTGQLARRLADADMDVTAVDLSQANTEHTTARGVWAAVTDFTCLPFRAGTFAAAFAFNALLHVPRMVLPQQFTEIRRVLSPGALLLAVTWGGRTADGPLPGEWLVPLLLPARRPRLRDAADARFRPRRDAAVARTSVQRPPPAGFGSRRTLICLRLESGRAGWSPYPGATRHSRPVPVGACRLGPISGRYRARSPGPTSGVGMCHRPVAWKPSRPAHPAEHHAITVDATIDVRGPYSSTE